MAEVRFMGLQGGQGRGMGSSRPAGKSGKSEVSCGKGVGRKEKLERVEKHLSLPSFQGWVQNPSINN